MAAIRCQEVYRITYEATAGSGRRWVDRKGDKDEATAGATRGNARQRQATPGKARQSEGNAGQHGARSDSHAIHHHCGSALAAPGPPRSHQRGRLSPLSTRCATTVVGGHAVGTSDQSRHHNVTQLQGVFLRHCVRCSADGVAAVVVTWAHQRHCHKKNTYL